MKVSLKTGFTIVLISAIFIAQDANSQDPRYTQEYNAPLRLNPALMGPNPTMKGIINYRSQWGNIDKGYTTYRFTFMYPLINDENGKLDIGLSVFNDQAGAFSNLNISLALGYSLNISGDHFLSAALIGGYAQKSIDLEGQTYDEQYVNGNYSETNPSNEKIWNEKRSYPDLGLGALWYMSPDGKLAPFVGFSMQHHNTPNESLRDDETSLPVVFNYHGGLKIVGDKFDFTPNVRISTQDGAQDYAIGTYADFKINESMKINAALWYRYRTQNAFAFMLGFEHDYFLIAYSFDLASFEMMNAAIKGASTHEINLGFMLKKKDQGAKPLVD